MELEAAAVSLASTSWSFSTSTAPSTRRDTPAAASGGAVGRARSVSRLPARVAGAVARGALTFVFAAVGMVLGAVTGGALIGLATESGLVRGAGVGAISGAVVSMEVVDSSVAIWRSHHSGIWSVLYVVIELHCFPFLSFPLDIIIIQSNTIGSEIKRISAGRFISST